MFVGCKNKGEDIYLKRLSEIQNLGDSLPSTAMDSLKVFNNKHFAPSKYTSLKEQLLEIRLRDKNFMVSTSDDSIKRIYDYFKENGSIKDLVEVNYYMASTYRDLNDSPRAVDYFLKAINLAETESVPDTMLIINACSQLVYIFDKLYQYKDVQELSLKEFELAKLSGRLNPRIIMDVYTSYICQRDTLKAFKYGKMAIQTILKKYNVDDYADVISELLYDYTKGNEKSDADECFKLLKTLKDERKPANYYLAMATYYNRYFSPDSAIFYLNEYFDKAHGESAKYYASLLLFQQYLNHKDITKAVYCASLMVKYSNSWTEKAKEDQTINSKNYFKYQRDKQEESNLKASAMRAKKNLVIGIMLSLLIIACLVAVYYFKKKKSYAKLMSIQKDAEASKQQIVQKTKELNEKRKSLLDMEKKIGDMDIELRNKEEELKIRMAQNAQLMKVAFMERMVETNNDILTKFKTAADGQYSIQEGDWKDLFAAVNAQYPGFETDIQIKMHRISEPLLRICYLLKIGMTNPQIENITNYPHQTVWRRVKKVTEIMGDSLLFDPSKNISPTDRVSKK